MSEGSEVSKRPDVVNGVQVRMPEDYDFNTWGKDFTDYQKDFRLRTDAVWEKYMLKDWFRLTNRVFFFDQHKFRYRFTEPEDMYMLILEPWGFEADEFMDWKGFTRTGVTSAFQVGVGAKQRVESSFNAFYSMPDYYMMCAMRFEKWWRCDMVYGQDRSTDFDRNPSKALTNLKDSERYPCFREFYEANYACADNIIKYLIELGYAKKANDFWVGETSNNEIRSFPTIFDIPNAPERITYTY